MRLTRDSVASGGGREPSVFFICKSACYTPVHLSGIISYNFLFLFQMVTRQNGVPNGRPPYPPVTRNILRDIFTLIFTMIFKCFE